MNRKMAQAVLEIPLSEEPTDEDVRRAFRRVASGLHPDRGGNTMLFQRAVEARSVLLSPATGPVASEAREHVLYPPLSPRPPLSADDVVANVMLETRLRAMARDLGEVTVHLDDRGRIHLGGAGGDKLVRAAKKTSAVIKIMAAIRGLTR